MELKPLGNSSVMIPEIGLGVWRYSGGVEPLRRGIELGASFIDTAEIYGTEDIVGQAVKGVRDRVFLATKVSADHLRYDDVLRAAEASLRRLDADRIDLYQIHWPNWSIPIQETLRAMETLVDRGMVRHIGVSNFSLDQLRQAQAAMSKYPIVSNQVLYNLNRREIERDLLPYCLMQRITIIAYTPLDDGRLATRSWFPQNWRMPAMGQAAMYLRRMQALEQVATYAQKTLAQVALNWCTSRPPVVVIPKSNTLARIEENCQASGWRLSPEQIQFLDAAFA
ncbi:MAG TPA: aldo/keto reductase [Methylomirabilota bacterium]|jgi:diketogulonate reductase-like aldo/keto reductase|nr:aldo/keto reductase [Methylomirabilota bacterium]